MNICISTSGLDTARVFLERGYEFEKKNIYIVSCFGNCEVYDFLKYEVGMDLYAEISKSDKLHYRIAEGITENDYITPLEFAFTKARFEAWAYLVREYEQMGVFRWSEEDSNAHGHSLEGRDIVRTNLEMLVKAVQWTIVFNSDR